MRPKEIIKSFHKFNRLHSNCIRSIMESEGLFYGQLPILEVVQEKGSCTQKEIVDSLQVSAPSVNTSVKRLVKKGYLKKQVDENDQRASLVSITPLGKIQTQACRNKFDEMDERVFKGLSAEERENLLTVMQFLIDNVSKETQND